MSSLEGNVANAAFAYVYKGEWVSDCPRPGCENAEFLYTQSRMRGPRDVRRTFFLCSNCGYTTEKIIWPHAEHKIVQILSKRPVPSTRNWYPRDHPVAVAFGVPHGQSVSDLISENEEHGVV